MSSSQEVQAKIRTHPRRNQILRNFLTGHNDIVIAAGEFGFIDREELMKYLEQLLEADIQYNTTDDIQVLLKGIITKFKSRTDEIMRMPIMASNYQQINQTIRSLNGLIATAGQLQQKLEGSPVIQIENLTLHYTKLEQFIITSLCESCRQKVETFLEANK